MKQLTLNENTRSVSGATFAGHVFSLTSSAFTASGTSVTITAPTIKVKYNTSADGRKGLYDSILVTPQINGVSGSGHGYATGSSYKLAYNTDKTMTTSAGNWSYTTSDLFNANNKTTKTLNINWVISVPSNRIISTGTLADGGASLGTIAYATSGSGTISAEGSVTLNAPPTFSATTTSAGAYYANLSKYTVSVASLSAKYGGTISSAVLTVGSATASRTTNGTLEVTVPSAGTYTPTVKVTDSRGQVTTQSLTAITVVAHTAPTLTATVTSSAPYYNMETDYSVSVSDIVTHDGATVSSITLKIGSQTVSRTDAGALTIGTSTAGNFTPTVTIVDSFGASTTYSLPQITVNPYATPALSFDIQRTLPTGKPDDEGECAVATATFNWTSAIADLVAPTVVATDPDGDPVTITADWYKTRASDGTFSDLISDWSTITPSDMPVYCLIGNSAHNAFNTQYSYQIAITPSDDTSAGITISQMLGGAFYTVDFMAGGHGIAFGQPATQDGFFCAMDAHFVDKADVMRALFDFCYPVGSYYHTSDASFDPNVSWGGTWTPLGEGQVLLSAGSTYTAGQQYGNNAPTLTDDQVAHTHSDTISYSVNSSGAVTNGISGGGHQHAGVRRNLSTNKTSGSAMFVGGNYTGSDAEEAVVTKANTGSHNHNLPNHTHTLTKSGSVTRLGATTRASYSTMQLSTAVYIWHRTA